MPLHAWTPIECLDDDLLTLEAAALVSLAVQHRAHEVKAAVETWRALQYNLSAGADGAGGVAKAKGVLNKLLTATGLVLPSAVARLASVEEALREMSRAVAEAQGDAKSIRAAIALLNLAHEKSSAAAPTVADLFCNGLLDKAWQEVEQFADWLFVPATAKRLTQMIMRVNHRELWFLNQSGFGYEFGLWTKVFE